MLTLCCFDVQKPTKIKKRRRSAYKRFSVPPCADRQKFIDRLRREKQKAENAHSLPFDHILHISVFFTSCQQKDRRNDEGHKLGHHDGDPNAVDLKPKRDQHNRRDLKDQRPQKRDRRRK